MVQVANGWSHERLLKKVEGLEIVAFEDEFLDGD